MCLYEEGVSGYLDMPSGGVIVTDNSDSNDEKRGGGNNQVFLVPKDE
ncbi:MAG: hypothetical protein PHE43_03220 [Candidatus Nanoarchaeia archaeon]|nr:hypothetical protein [Candidatus Nanoarchaeia archaeon]